MWELVLKEDLAALEAKISALQADIQALKDAPTIPDGIEERIEALEALTNPSGMATPWAWFENEIFTRYPSTQRPTLEGLGNEKTKLINGGNYVSNDGRLRVGTNARVAKTDTNNFVDVPDRLDGTSFSLCLIGEMQNMIDKKQWFVAIKINGKAKIKGVVFSNKNYMVYIKIFNSSASKIYEKGFNNNRANVSYGFEFDYDGGYMSQGDTLYIAASASSTLALRQLKVNC